ncbi:hypothetical protein KA107_02685 [Candidatus Pacearchaeota archaeon]|nr:hypothetical protein [Candidatus Pacearchaeota archaeon]
MNNQKLLIVEDKADEAIFARDHAISAGFKEVTLATTLEEAQKYLPGAQAVVSDLFFPAGNVSTETYVQRFLPLYEGFKQRRFQKTDGNNIVLRVIQGCAETFGITPEKYVEEFIAKCNTPVSVLKAARDAVRGIADSDKYDAFLKIEQGIKEGKNLPLGIIVAEQAKERGLPALIVTSTNHHHDSFEPVRSLVPSPYFDNLIEGRKNWAGAMDYLKQHGGTQ